MIKDLDQTKCMELLRNNYIGRLAFVQGKSPYIIPITYYYHDRDARSIISYSAEGHKIRAMRKNTSVSLEVDEIESVSKWKSVLVHGQFEELEGIDAKSQLHEFVKGVKSIINKKEEKQLQFIHEFSSKLISIGPPPVVYRIKIVEITGKVREE
ncbi:pyridoxamine 5'-phosphate oxidase family protein [Poritiphilus flavus]|uniref:Flavin mononucleotide-binding protein n=1 Tax=Poritiphilus flavus TaxID=2697053 RepID=A0A6L9EG64_9FLAO|nr:pyridoxamine 5'-phosphate oxidase family protein [Poritiphilus flavus]NAS13725.1 flavin mononucleotide-binding protein [Poritiphilus flavus]